MWSQEFDAGQAKYADALTEQKKARAVMRAAEDAVRAAKDALCAAAEAYTSAKNKRSYLGTTMRCFDCLLEGRILREQKRSLSVRKAVERTRKGRDYETPEPLGNTCDYCEVKLCDACDAEADHDGYGDSLRVKCKFCIDKRQKDKDGDDD